MSRASIIYILLITVAAITPITAGITAGAVDASASPSMNQNHMILSRGVTTNLYPSTAYAIYSFEFVKQIGSSPALCIFGLNVPPPPKTIERVDVSISGGRSSAKIFDMEVMLSYTGYAYGTTYSECIFLSANYYMKISGTARIFIVVTTPPQREGFYDLSRHISETGSIIANIKVIFSDGSSSEAQVVLKTAGVSLYIYRLDARIQSVLPKGVNRFGSLQNGSIVISPTYTVTLLTSLSGPQPPPGQGFTFSGYYLYSSEAGEYRSGEISLSPNSISTVSMEIPILPGSYRGNRSLSMTFVSTSHMFSYPVSFELDVHGSAVMVSRPLAIVTCIDRSCYGNSTIIVYLYSYQSIQSAAIDLLIYIEGTTATIRCSVIAISSGVYQCSDRLNVYFSSDQIARGRAYVAVALGSVSASDSTYIDVPIVSAGSMIELVKNVYRGVRLGISYIFLAVTALYAAIAAIQGLGIQVISDTLRAISSQISTRFPMLLSTLAMIYAAPYAASAVASVFARAIGSPYIPGIYGDPESTFASAVAPYLIGVSLAKAIFFSFLDTSYTYIALAISLISVNLVVAFVILRTPILASVMGATISNHLITGLATLYAAMSFFLFVGSVTAVTNILIALMKILILLSIMFSAFTVVTAAIAVSFPSTIPRSEAVLGASVFSAFLVPAISPIPLAVYNIISTSIKSTIDSAVNAVFSVAVLQAVFKSPTLFVALASLYAVSASILAGVMILVSSIPFIALLIASRIFADLGRAISSILLRV